MILSLLFTVLTPDLRVPSKQIIFCFCYEINDGSSVTYLKIVTIDSAKDGASLLLMATVIVLHALYASHEGALQIIKKKCLG